MQSKLSFVDFICVFFIAFSAAVGLTPSLNPIAIYVLLPITFLVCLIRSNFLGGNNYFAIILALYVWIALSSTWAQYEDAANRQLHQITGVIFLCVSLITLGKKVNLLPWLYIIYIVLYISVWKYAYDNMLSIMTDATDRLSDDSLNANTFGYYTFFYTFSTFMVSQITKGKVSILFYILFFAAIPISLFTALFTASRQILVIQIPLLSMLLIAKYLRFNARSFWRFLIVCFALFLFVKFIGLDLYDGSLLSERNEMTSEDETRMVLLRDAFSVGIQNPLLGVGANNFMYYTSKFNFSHCTYLELFANTGLLGALLFILLIVKFLRSQFIKYKNTHDVLFMYFLIFGFVYAVDNFFYVFYADLWLMGFFFLIISHSETYYLLNYKNRKIVDNNENLRT